MNVLFCTIQINIFYFTKLFYKTFIENLIQHFTKKREKTF